MPGSVVPLAMFSINFSTDSFTDLTPADEDTNWILTDNDKTLPEAQRT